MCGICGKVTFGEAREDTYDLIREMTSALDHRGPDDSGHFEFISKTFSLFFGHTRLSVIDLSQSGHQPMQTLDGRYTLIYNGELYNYHELKTELKREGVEFTGTSDSEVLLHLFAREKLAALPKLNGMFSFALYDSEEKSVYIARDRFGIKPLYYYKDVGKFVFASELGSLLKDKSIKRELDYEALYHYLSFNFIPAPNTIFQNIKKLEPGHYLKLTGNRLEVERWYDVRETKMLGEMLSLDDAKKDLRAIMEDSVKKRLIADVPVGAFLSGGIDSSIVVALAAKHATKPLETFSIGYKDEGMYDETAYAKKVAQLYDTEHNEIKLGHADILDALPGVLDAFDEPFADSSAIVQNMVCKAAGRRLTVALSGDGADEVFAGYRKYLGEYYQRFYLMFPGVVRKLLIEPLMKAMPDSKDSAFLEQMRRAKKFVSKVNASPSKRHFGWMEIFSRDQLEKLMTHFNERLSSHPLRMVSELYDGKLDDRINAMLYVDQNIVLPYDMLTKVDMMSMKNSLEVRVPFLDHRLVELSYFMRGTLKLNRNKRKFVLIEAFKDLLPESVLKRGKQGFEVPIGKWFKKELKDTFFDIVNKKDIEADGIFNYSFIEKLYSDHLNLRVDNSMRLYNIFAFMWWRKKSGISF